MEHRVYGISSALARVVDDGTDRVAVVEPSFWRLYDDPDEAWTALAASMVNTANTFAPSPMFEKRSVMVCDLAKFVLDDSTHELVHISTHSFTRTGECWFEGRRWNKGHFRLNGEELSWGYHEVSTDDGQNYRKVWDISTAELDWCFNTFSYGVDCPRLIPAVTDYFRENPKTASLAHDVVTFLSEFGFIYGDCRRKTPLGISLDCGRSYRLPNDLSAEELSGESWERIAFFMDDVLREDLHSEGFPDTVDGRRDFLAAYLRRAGVIVGIA